MPRAARNCACGNRIYRKSRDVPWPDTCLRCTPSPISDYDCRHCGATFQHPKPKKGKSPFCCHKCKAAQAKDRYKKGTKNKCCNCNADFMASSKPVKYCEPCRVVLFSAKQHKCQNCGTMFTIAGGKQKGLFCSVACTGQYRRRMNQSGLRKLAEFCRVLFAKERRRRISVLRKLADYCQELLECDRANKCRQCGGDVPNPFGSRPDRFCSQECRRARRQSLKPKGSQKHTTRARKKNLPRIYSIGIAAVGDRDEWTCRLCGEPIESRQGHHADPLSPCVDHIVPLGHKANTRHGHVWNNVQIAHRRCNEAKQDRLACWSLIECDDPRQHVLDAGIDQASDGVPIGGKLTTGR
jgi:hypothetical protein